MMQRVFPVLPRVFLGLGLLVSTLLVGCDGDADDDGKEGEGETDGGQTGPCQDRQDCPDGTICNLQASPAACVAPPAVCEGNQQCPAGSLCAIDHCEPGCNNSADCRHGWACKQVTAGVNRCAKSCEKRSDCPDGYLCEGLSCVPEVVLCSPCTGDDDCGGAADRCVESAAGKFCAKDCSLSGDCAEGYRCETLRDGARECVPASGDCTTICPLNACPTGQLCNRTTGRCHEKLAACDPCVEHAECGEVGRCLTLGEGKFCLTPCPNGPSDCPDRFTCNTSGSTPYCLPLSGTCDRCSGVSCGPLAPYCNPEDGTCLECLSGRHCSLLESCSSSSSCIAVGPACGGEETSACPATQPFCFDQRCVECLSSGDCPSGEGLVCYHFRCMGDDFCQRVSCPNGTACDRETRRCIETGTCRTDVDCPGRRCDATRGVCYDADGSCQSAGECPPRLECDLERRVCTGCSADSDCRPLQACWPLGDPLHQRYCHQL